MKYILSVYDNIFEKIEKTKFSLRTIIWAVKAHKLMLFKEARVVQKEQRQKAEANKNKGVYFCPPPFFFFARRAMFRIAKQYQDTQERRCFSN